MIHYSSDNRLFVWSDGKYERFVFNYSDWEMWIKDRRKVYDHCKNESKRRK